MAPKQYDNTLIQAAGNVGREPEVKQSQKGPWTTFSLATNHSYDENSPEPTRWYRVGVNNEQLQAFVRQNLRKGTPIVVEGGYYETEYQGVVQHNINAFRIGLVDWFVKGTAKPARAVEDEDL